MADSSHGSGASEHFVAPPSPAVSRRKSSSRKNLSRALSSGLDLSSFDVPADPGTAQQALFDAATSGNGAVVAQLLEAGTPANTVERTAGDTPLICAAMQGHTAIVQRLLEAGAWVNVANLSSESALHVAAWEGHKDIVEMLLAAGAEVDQHGPEGETPLLLAADGGHVDVAEVLLDAGADASACNDRGEDPFAWAAWTGNLPMLALLFEHGSNIHRRDMHPTGGWTPFLGACQQGHTEAAQYLITKGARVDVLDNYGRSGLWLAASHGFTDCVRMLLRNGLRPMLDTPANAGPTETRGRTPLLIAAMHGHTEVVKELLDVGPVLNAIDADGCSALHLAAQDGHAAAVRLLKEHGIVDGLPNLAGRCPADLARQHGHAAIAKGLAEGAVSKSNVVPDGIWELVELALQAYNSARAPSKAELDAAIEHACRETKTGTYMGSTLRFLLEKHGCPAGA